MKSFGTAGCLSLFAWIALAQALAQQAVAPNTTLAGKVSDATGEPLSGVIVRLEQDGWEIARFRTTDSGQFELSASVREGPGILWAHAIDFLPVRTNLPLPAAPAQRLDLVLRGDTSISGNVVALDKSPLPYIVIQAVPLPAPEMSPQLAAAGAPSENEGTLQAGLMGEYFLFSESLKSGRSP